MHLIELQSSWVSTATTRLTIVCDGGEGKIQVDLIYKSELYGRTAYIWDLYIHPDHRRKGIARQLMQQALHRARDFGFETATLEWVLQDTPRHIAQWYARLGFEEREFSDEYALMVKKL